VRVDHFPLDPFAGLGTWAAFMPTPDGAMAMGDTVVFQDEVNPAMDAAFAHGLEVTGLHNHFFYDEPKVYFMHIGGHGNAVKLASGVKAVWDAIRKVRQADPTPASRFGAQVPKPGKFDVDRLETIFGRKSESQHGVVKFTIGRATTMHSVEASGSMGVTTWAAFSGSDDSAVVDGDFAMHEDELQPVREIIQARVLRRDFQRAGIDIQANGLRNAHHQRR
jgi:hypothetical protein